MAAGGWCDNGDAEDPEHGNSARCHLASGEYQSSPRLVFIYIPLRDTEGNSKGSSSHASGVLSQPIMSGLS